MNRFFRALIAGYGAKKLGGGCFSTIIVFLLIYWALGTCNRQPAQRHSGIPKQTQTAFSKHVPFLHSEKNSSFFLFK